MSMFSLAISCLITPNLLWFMDLSFQVPIPCYSLEHRTSLHHQSHPHRVLLLLWLSPFTLSGVISPLLSSSIVGTYRPGEFLFQCPIFLPFILFTGLSRQEHWSGLPDHAFPELSTMTRPSWVALHIMAHRFIKSDKAVVHVISLISFLRL